MNNYTGFPQGVAVTSTEVIWARTGPDGRIHRMHKVTGTDKFGITWTWLVEECSQRLGRPKGFERVVEEAVK